MEETDENKPEVGETPRRLYAEKFAKQSAEARAAIAPTVQEPDLTALCFDPIPSTIKALLSNSHFGLSHARLIAAHHITATGLDFVANVLAFRRDVEFQRLLLRNSQLSVALLRKIVQGKRLLEIFRLSASHDYTERTRQILREVFRSQFSTCVAEEKVELIFKTEGRALMQLAGIPIDGKTTSLLCARPYASIQLISALARWSSTPPALIQHLLKQPIVQRQPQVRAMLLARK